MVEMSLKLARSFEKRNEKEKAEQGFKFCIDTQVNNSNNNYTTATIT